MAKSFGLPVFELGLRNIAVSILSAAVVVDSDASDGHELDILLTYASETVETEETVGLKRGI